MESNERVKIYWASKVLGDGIGNAFGYKVHNDTLREYVSKIADITEDAEDAIQIVSPEYVRKIPGKVNWVFSMFEGGEIPEPYVEKLSVADFWLVPSMWVKLLFAKYFDRNRIFVVNHGVKSIFKYKKRKFPRTKPFRFLWVGAPNPRKGWEEIIHLWKNTILSKTPHFELYLKTTRIGGIRRQGNVIVDGRVLPEKDLLDLYHSAHCFLLPHRGEGFALSLAEAMATGLPCIATGYSGVTDFFDESVGYPIKYSHGKGEVKFSRNVKGYYVDIVFPHLEDMFDKISYVYSNYNKALKKGHMASRRIHSRFTWEKAAERLVNLIRNRGE